MDKYSKIILLTHPLYDVFYAPSSIISSLVMSDIDKKKLDLKKTSREIKKTLMVYGKFITENTSKDSVILLLKPDISIFYPDNLRVRKLSEKYDFALNKFCNFFNKKFENRFFVYQGNAFTDLAGRTVFPSPVYSKFKKNLEIVSFGEYFNKSLGGSYSGCVPAFSKKLSLFLEKKGFSSEIIFAEKYTLPFEKEKGFRFLLKTPTEKRRLKNKEKKKKLNLKRKLR